jgi:tetratricopeptide (TPR) repeat protein
MALQVYTPQQTPMDWAKCQNNLGSARKELGKREGDTEQFRKAVQAHDAALTVVTPDGSPIDWAMSQNNKGSALLALGEREEGTPLLEDAAAAFRESLKVYESARAIYFVNLVRNNLTKAERLLAQRRSREE